METLPLRLTHRHDQPARLLLGDLDIARFVAPDGLRIEYVEIDRSIGGGVRTMPQVTITFALGRLDLDLDIDLLRTLLDAAERKAGA